MHFVFLFFLLFFLFIYPAIRVFNVLFDFSKPITYQTEVIEINREVGWRGFVSYEMHLKLWSEEGGVFNEVRVAQETYENVAPGSLVEIKESNGALGAKWFTVHLDGKELNDSDLNFF